MAKQDYIFRHLTIIKKLKSSGESTFEEINAFLKKESAYQDRPVSITVRTFERDRNEILSLYNIDIQYDFARRVYFIANDQQSDLNDRMLESIDMINSLKMVSDLTQYMIFEKRKAMGTHHFHGLLHAIKNRIVISLRHQKYAQDEPGSRLAEPLALKESKGRWYLLARDTADRRLKTFGLDRILDFEITARRFDYPAGLNVNEIFRDCFGVINPDDSAPANIVLSFRREQGKYIKSYPLHESQTILEDNEKELRIRLHLHITHDLIMEILSYGEMVLVLQPKKLRTKISSIYSAAMERYLRENAQ